MLFADLLFLYIVTFLMSFTSGNRTPGSRFYSDLSDTSFLHPPARIQASFKALGYAYNWRRLADGSFQLTRKSRDVHTVQLMEPLWPKRRQSIITALTTLPQG